MMSEQIIQEENSQEASMNFEKDKVFSFLQRIIPLIDSGFSETEINQVQREIEKMEFNEESEIGRFEIEYQSKEIFLIINAFLDSPEEVDIYIITEPELATLIQDEMIRIADEIEADY